jgi:pimeloyl-ACP methyl ester carboxylesterase
MRLRLFLAALALAPAAVALPAASHAAEAPARFSVTVEGSGADVIMIPGLMSPRSVWDDAVASLGGRYRVHLIQIGGFAGEPAGANAEGPLLEPIADALAAYIEDNRIERPAVVGHSMGGLLGLMLAERHPELVGKLLIVDSLPFYSMLMSPTATPASVEPQAAAFRDGLAGMSDEAFAAQQAASYRSLVATEAARPALIDQSAKSDRKVAARAVYEVMTTDMRPKLAGIATPITVLYATNAYATDALVGPLFGSFEAAAHARVMPIADSYHFIMIDQPEAFAAALKAFLVAR